jgi:hypothetical protein
VVIIPSMDIISEGRPGSDGVEPKSVFEAC